MATKSNLTGRPLQIYTGLDAATSNLLSTALQYTSGTDLTCRNITAAGSETIAGTLNVTGAINAPAITASIANTPTVNATAVNTTNVVATGNSTTVNQTVSGTATINTLTTSGATLGGTTNMNVGAVSGALSSASLSTGAIAASGGYTQSGSGTNSFPGQINAVNISASNYTGGTVSVANVSASGTVAASTNLTSPAAAITTLGSNTVTANAVNATTLSSSSAATLNSLAVTNNETVGGTLTVTGTSTLAGVNSTGTVAASNVTATSATVTNLSAGTITATNLSYSGTGTFPSLGVTGNTTTGSLTVSGSAAIPNIGGTTTVAGAVNVSVNDGSNASSGGLWLDSSNISSSGGNSWDSHLMSYAGTKTVDFHGRHDGGDRYMNLFDHANVTGSLVVGSAKTSGQTRSSNGSITSTGAMTANGMLQANAGANLNRTKLSLWGPADTNNVLYYDATPDGSALVGWQGGYLGGKSSGSLVKAVTWDANGNAGVTGILSANGPLYAGAGFQMNDNVIHFRGISDNFHTIAYSATRDGPALHGNTGFTLGNTAGEQLYAVGNTITIPNGLTVGSMGSNGSIYAQNGIGVSNNVKPAVAYIVASDLKNGSGVYTNFGLSGGTTKFAQGSLSASNGYITNSSSVPLVCTVFGNVLWQSNSSGYRTHQIVTSDSTVWTEHLSITDAGTGYCRVSISALVSIPAGGTAYILVGQNSGGNLNASGWISAAAI